MLFHLCLRFVMSYIIMQFTKSKTWAPSLEYIGYIQYTVYRVHHIYFLSCCTKTSDMLLGYRLILWCKAREQKVVFLASAEEWSSTVLNWGSDQRGIWAEGPVAPSNTIIPGTPGCCSCLSWLTTSSFDPSHESWQVPRWSRHKHKSKVHTLTKACRHTQNVLYVGGHIHTAMQLGLMRTILKTTQSTSSIWIKREAHRWWHKRKDMHTLVYINHPAIATQIKYRWPEVHLLLGICGNKKQASQCIFPMQPYFAIGQHHVCVLLFNLRLQ